MILYHPVVHYVFYGVYEGADLVETFNSKYYLDKYSDVLKLGVNPYCEYLRHGKHEGRSTTSQFLSHADFLSNINCDDAGKTTSNKYRNILSFVELSNSYVLVFEHGVGGGSEEYINKKLIPGLNGEFEYIGVITPNRSKKTNGFELVIIHNDIRTKIYISKPSDVLAFGPSKIIINNVAYYKSNLLENVFQLIDGFSGKLDILFHDFYSLCPSVVLMGDDSIYCGLDKCDNCSVINKKKLSVWRSDWQKIFDKANRITFFSESSKEIAEKVFKFSEEKIDIVPHAPLVEYGFEANYKYDAHKELVVGIVGAANKVKGLDVILKMAEDNPSINFVIVGYVVNEYQAQVAKFKNIIVTGAYQQAQLPDLLKEHNIKVAAITSVVPETFCYVLQELMMLEYPVVSFDIGAQGERTEKYKYGIVVQDTDASSMFGGIQQLQQQLGALYE
jgi:glycosyltransferase involved in cell wall biosynthesis